MGAPKSAPGSEEVMNRKLLFGVALLVGLMPVARPEAAPAKSAADARLTSSTASGESILRAEGKGVIFSKRVGKDRVVMHLEVPRDRIDLEVNMDGTVRIVRNGKVVAAQMKSDTASAVARIQKLTSGSSALAGFEALVAGVANDQRAEAQSLRVSHALLHVVRGNNAPAMAFRTRGASRSASGVVRAMALVEEGPSACWAEYEVTVDRYNVQFNDCISDYWWIPGWNAACGLQFAIQAELAWFWVISCSGGMPV
jgi:hypothetical protein